MVTVKTYSVLRSLIKDTQSLINYIENYLLSIVGIPYVSNEVGANGVRLLIQDEGSDAELRINHEMRVKGHGRAKNLLNALILRYLGTDGSRRITILLIRRGNTLYRVDDLPKLQSLPISLIGIMLVSIAMMSLAIAVLRVINVLPSIHVITILLLTPLLIPIIYSYLVRVWVRRGDLRNSQVIKLVLSYSDLNEERFTNALRFLGKVDNARSLGEIRRFIFSLINNPSTAPDDYHEEVIDMDSIVGRLGIGNYGIYLVNMNQCNAASVGMPGMNYIILTSRIISCLSAEELMAVLAHEAGHIVHGDSAKTLFLLSLYQLINVALITYVIPTMVLPAIPIIIAAVLLELFTMVLMMRLSEYSADRYAMRFVEGKVLARALLRVTWRELYDELEGKRRVRMFNAHPSVSSRLLRINPRA